MARRNRRLEPTGHSCALIAIVLAALVRPIGTAAPVLPSRGADPTFHTCLAGPVNVGDADSRSSGEEQ